MLRHSALIFIKCSFFCTKSQIEWGLLDGSARPAPRFSEKAQSSLGGRDCVFSLNRIEIGSAATVGPIAFLFDEVSACHQLVQRPFHCGAR